MPIRNAEAGTGWAKIVRNACSNSRPTMPTGIVASTSNHARRWSTVLMPLSRTLVSRPAMTRTQSRRKKTTKASAVATCMPTMNAR